jgi:hypothetical protein
MPRSSRKDFDVKLFQFAVIAWALWTNRNKTSIEKKIPLSPFDVLFKIEMLLQISKKKNVAAEMGSPADGRRPTKACGGGAMEKDDDAASYTARRR